MTENKGDLISREALKETIIKICGKCSNNITEYDENHMPNGNCAIWHILNMIDNAPTVNPKITVEQAIDKLLETGWLVRHDKEMTERPQGDIKKYKPLEPDYNVQCAVENLKTAYWSNEPEKDAKNFTEAEDIIISAICHHGYTVCKQPQGEWVATKYYTWECSKCGKNPTIGMGYVQNHTELYNFCPNCGASMKKGGAE